MSTFFGSILRWIYDLTQNYGWSIILFALLAKVVMLPLNIKQTRSLQINAIIQPKIAEIQKKYKDNQQKQNEELQKLYTENHYNPLSGCLPTVIQLPIIIGMFNVLREPTKYVFTAAEYANVSQSFLWIENLTESAWTVLKANGFSLISALTLVLPIFSVVFTYLQSKQTNTSNPQAGSMGAMMAFMPLFIGYISLIYTQGLALYWTFNTVVGVILQEAIVFFFPIKTGDKLEKKGGDKYDKDSDGKRQDRRRSD